MTTGPAPSGSGPAGSPTPEDALAAFVAGLRAEAVPAAVRDRTADLLLDAIASALAGRATVDAPRMAAAARAFAGPGSSTVIGGEPLALAGATLLNGYLVTAATVCDVHRPILCHVTPEVVPAALAIAEARGSDGPTLLAALAAGFETTVRVGLALGYGPFRARGWHAPGVAGPFGAAAASARLLGLDAATTRHALGFAGSQAAGTFAGLGSAQVKFHQARGAVSGVLAALVAEAGLDAADRILTAPDGGLLGTYSDGGDAARLTRDLGTAWELLGISLRRWPTASSLQPVAQAALAVAADGGPGLAGVERVLVELPEAAFRLNGSRTWRDQLSAFQSAAYVAAVTLADGRCWLEQFAPDRLGDPALRAFVDARVEVAAEPSLPPTGARLTVERSGRPAAIVRVDRPAGDPTDPLSRADLRAKLAAAAAGTDLAGRVDAIADLALGLERAASVEPLLAALRGAAR